ncbi:aminotransferase class V-fold PLP-dependent enzyme [Candidatus Uhrbacteria bacterium]|nr:aminotransferase class V-fold PLP-dependent enzyme [Candidatus Uhrbacteria bacterium]
MTKRSVYLDCAATTPLDPRVRAAMEPYFEQEYGNPSSLYAAGRSAKEALDGARKRVAAVLGCSPDELTFTGSGTESDNMAILGVPRWYAARSFLPLPMGGGVRGGGEGHPAGHVIISAIEHHAVLNAAEHLRKEGFDVTVLPVDQYGMVSPDAVRAALTPQTTLISIMTANNEIGTIEPIQEIGKVIRDWKREQGRKATDPPFLHTDACQAAGALDLNVQKLGVDLLTVNGSKIYGPKGTGVLYARRGVRLEPLVYGGGQERRLRSGTENVAGIIGLATALEISQQHREEENARLVELRDRLIHGIQERIPKVVLNGHPTERLPNNVNVSILDIEGEAVLLYLDAKGIAAATGSACDSESLDPSHVILAIGRPYEYAHASIRFTLGRSSTVEDIAYVLEVLPGIVEKLRKISPVKLDLGQQAVIGSGASMDMASAFVGMGRPHWEKVKMQNAERKMQN